MAFGGMASQVTRSRLRSSRRSDSADGDTSGVETGSDTMTSPLWVQAAMTSVSNDGVSSGRVITLPGEGGKFEAADSGGSVVVLRPWDCTATCNVQQVDPDATCPERVQGTGRGPTEDAGCKAAKKHANTQVPAGCYKRHCKCNCSK